MAQIESAFAPTDGVACFNRLYKKTTEEVNAAAKNCSFEDRPFMERLDVVFANRYFAALEASLRADSEGLPGSWAALFDARQRSGVAPLQFGLAGMNAHINYDLSQAVVACCVERGVELSSRTPQHRDFLVINTVLRDTEPQVKEWFLTGALATIDDLVGSADDAAAIWSISRARDAAWVAAETTWALRPMPSMQASYIRTLDGIVGLAGRGLLRAPLSALT